MQLPGYRELECGVWKLLELHFPQLVRGIGLHNGHILRQFRAADGGSGFDYHVDDADQALIHYQRRPAPPNFKSLQRCLLFGETPAQSRRCRKPV